MTESDIATAGVDVDPCQEHGSLIAKGGCYALRRDDGTDVWLEIDPIPLHLIDQPVRIEGARYESELIVVAFIAPA